MKMPRKKRFLLYNFVKKVVRQASSRGTVYAYIHIKADCLWESQNFVQHLKSDVIKNPSFTVHMTHLVKQHMKADVLDETISRSEALLELI